MEFSSVLVVVASPSGLAQLELEGAELHGLQADGRVVGQRSAGVHEGERDGLQQLHVQVPKQARHAQLQETQAALQSLSLNSRFDKSTIRVHRRSH